jgi:hypothetical protein
MFAPGKPFQPSLLFLGKARCLPSIGTPERCFTLVGSCLTRKHTILESLARHKRCHGLWSRARWSRESWSPATLVVPIRHLIVWSREI